MGSAAVATNSTEHATCRSDSTCWAIHATVESTRISPAFCRKRSSAARPFATLRPLRAMSISRQNSPHSASYAVRSAGVSATGMPEIGTGPQGAARCSIAGGRSSASQPRTSLRSAARRAGSVVQAAPYRPCSTAMPWRSSAAANVAPGCVAEVHSRIGSPSTCA